jgi:hypothetical protein
MSNTFETTELLIINALLPKFNRVIWFNAYWGLDAFSLSVNKGKRKLILNGCQSNKSLGFKLSRIIKTAGHPNNKNNNPISHASKNTINSLCSI